MSAGDLLAIDVAILLPAPARARVGRLNAALDGPPAGFRFDATHLPHITLVQQFLHRDRFDELTEAVGSLLLGVLPIELATTTITTGRTASTLTVVSAPLVDLHRRLMERLEPLEIAEGSGDAFFTDEEPARPADVEWVTRYRTRSSDSAYQPHVTLGIGTISVAVAPMRFTATQVAVCHLGRFCTCRAVLHEWTLTGWGV